MFMGFVEPMQRPCVERACVQPCPDEAVSDDAWPAAALCGCFLLLVLFGWTVYFWP
jgi:hypothetical protein